jgi:hypothetical protein
MKPWRTYRDTELEERKDSGSEMMYEGGRVGGEEE